MNTVRYDCSHRASMLVTTAILLVAATVPTYSAKILAFFPLPVPSHHFVFRPVLEELGRRGHEVLYVSAFVYESPPQGIEQMDISEYQKQHEEEFDHKEFGESSITDIVKMMFRFGSEAAEVNVGNPKVQGLIHSNQKFDAVIFESYFIQEYLSALVHKFDAIGIEFMSLGDFSWTNELAGLPDNPSYQLDWKTELTKDMDFWQRLYSTYVTGLSTLLSYHYLRSLTQPIMDRYFNYTGWERRPPIDVLARNRSLILVNADPVLGYPFPTAPHLKPVGGVNIRPNRPLPEDIQKFMDGSEHGVIYMSFGSNVNLSHSSNLKLFDSFMNVFKELPQSVLIKYESKYSGSAPANVKMNKWMPQQDILAHKSAVLFITHGGLLSMAEAVYHGVPMLGVPFFADQPKNLMFAEEQGFGRMLRHRNVTSENVLWNIREILSNKRYRAEAGRRSTMFRDRRHSPLEEAVYWIEHSLKYPFALTPTSANLSAVQLHMVDVAIFIVTVSSLTLYVMFWAVRWILRAFLVKRPKKKQKQH